MAPRSQASVHGAVTAPMRTISTSAACGLRCSALLATVGGEAVSVGLSAVSGRQPRRYHSR